MQSEKRNKIEAFIAMTYSLPQIHSFFYIQQPLPESMRSYLDERKKAALTMHEDDSGRHHLVRIVNFIIQII